MEKELVNRTFLDRLTKLDDLQAENIATIRAESNKQLTALDTIARALGAPSVKTHYDANYPVSGKKSLTAGTTIFHLPEGRVELDDDTEEYMSHPIPNDICRSILILTDKTINIKLFENDRPELDTSIFPSQWRKTYVEFNRIELTTTAPTYLYLAVSTESEGVPEVRIADYKEGNPFISRDTVAVAGTPNTEDIRTALNRTAHDGYITNSGVGAGVLQVYFSSDGTTFTTDFITIRPFGVFNVSNEDIAQLQIDTDINGTQYEIFLS